MDKRQTHSSAWEYKSTYETCGSNDSHQSDKRVKVNTEQSVFACLLYQEQSHKQTIGRNQKSEGELQPKQKNKENIFKAMTKRGRQLDVKEISKCIV